jgi:cation diffusion facilitator CzcD-associated flavoprotein CzcO/amino acid transporter
MTDQAAFSASPPWRARKRFTDLSTSKVTILVIAAAAPLAAVIGNMPVAFTLGGGLMMPAAFVVTAITLVCFAAGYTAMSREIVSTGAFYTYIAQGLGRTAGAAAAYVAVVSYAAYAVGLTAGVGYFLALLTRQFGIDVPWIVCAAGACALIGLLGYRSLDLNANTLMVFLVAEFAVLGVFDIAVLARKGAAALPLQVFATHAFDLSGDGLARAGVAMLYAVICFVGFESAALYGEETREPTRSVPRATYMSLALIAGFYAFTVWCMIGAVGPASLRSTASRESGDLMIALAGAFVGPVFAQVTGLFLVTSLLASLLALHNVASRYVFALARERLLPRTLAAFHPAFHSPHRASLLMSGLELTVVGALWAAGLGPYLGIGTGAIGVGTVGIIGLQVAAAFAAFVWLRRRGSSPITATLSLMGGLGLLAALILVVASYRLLTGLDQPWVAALPWTLLAIALAGAIYAQYLARRRPEVFGQLARSDYRVGGLVRTAPQPTYRSRYCLVGAGPAGLIMARAMLKEGVPFDWFERHCDVGGIWDPDNPGSPMYRSAHFISSKWTSYFFGYPMPGHYPDYPGHEQILDYVKGFARDFGLARHVTLNTSVEKAAPQADGRWQVSLSTGESRPYDGLICASGVTWHPSIPALPGAETFAGEIRHSVTYRSADEFRGRRVLVVGGGNSGVDIACDAARGAAAAFISLRRGYRFVPKHIFGVPTDLFINEHLSPPKGVAFPSDLNALLDALSGDLTRLGLKKPDHDALTSHPIMNTQILHHLAHGDVTAKGDILRLTPTGVVFEDGSSEDVDLVLLATGYDYRLPYLDESLFEWKGGRPQLYLNTMHRRIDSLYLLGFVEFADAAYRRFDEMAQTILADINARETGLHGRLMLDLRRQHDPDLRGGIAYLDSARHANYVDAATFKGELTRLRRRLGWQDPDDRFYLDMRR